MLRKLLVPETNLDMNQLFTTLESQIHCGPNQIAIQRTAAMGFTAKITAIGITEPGESEVKYAVENYTDFNSFYENVRQALRNAGYIGVKEDFVMGRASIGINAAYHQDNQYDLEIFGEVPVTNFYSGAPMTTVIGTTTHTVVNGASRVRFPAPEDVSLDLLWGADDDTTITAGDWENGLNDLDALLLLKPAIAAIGDGNIFDARVNWDGANTTIDIDYVGAFGSLQIGSGGGAKVTGTLLGTYPLYQTLTE